MLRCLNELVSSVGLETLGLQTQALFKLLTQVMSKTSKQDLLDLTFRLLSAVFRFEVPKMTHVEYEILFYTLKENLHMSDETRGPIEFLKTLVDVQFIKPQVYDIMPRVMDLLFSTEDEKLQETSIKALEGFIVNFPIDKNLYLSFFNDVVKNMENESRFVRRGLVSLIHRFIEAHKVDYYRDMVQMFLLKYSTARVNETDPEIKEMIEELIKTQVAALVPETGVDSMYSSNDVAEVLRMGLLLAGNETPSISFSGFLLINALIGLQETKTIKKLLKAGGEQIVASQIDNIAGAVMRFKDEVARNREARKQGEVHSNEPSAHLAEIDASNDLVVLLLQIYTSIYYQNGTVQLKDFVSSLAKLFNHPNPAVQGSLMLISARLLEDRPDELAGSKSALGKIIAHLLNLTKKRYYKVEEYGYSQLVTEYILLAAKAAPEYFKNVFIVLLRIAKLATVC